MKKITILLISTFFIAGCKTVLQERISLETIKEVKSKTASLEQKQQILLQFKELNGYFLKNNVKLLHEINFFTISSLNKLNKILSVAKTMTNTINIPDFDKNVVIVAATKPSKILNTIAMNKIYMIDNNMYVEYDIKSTKAQELGYFVLNVQVFEIEKPKAITNVCFIDSEKKMTVVPFGNRNMNSPSSISDMLKNYTGIYKGTFPTADCGGEIFTELNLKSNYTYTLKQKYLATSSRIFESSGKWLPSEDLYSFTLNNNEDLMFYFANKDMIEKLNNAGEKINSGLYKLKK
ncbi:MAG: copper resistance protein NlpE N-terminal domain-containing protein [Endomicrobium sp.]|jgi:hypothetical protein|nr:copper resistance protein NlpE N-terminal domain-containing protein [Endomicrobium sp.]